MFPNNQQIINKGGNIRNFKLDNPQSEMHHQFQNPVIKKPPVTRNKRMEQFLWHEFYEEYIRSKENSLNGIPSKTTIITEYGEEYGKLLDTKKNDMEIAEGMLTERHPLYADAAITFWNPKGGEFSSNFGKNLSITLPISQQHGQFG